ncbi:MAG: hypothetical protein ABUL49_01720, partial [bacterium]
MTCALFSVSAMLRPAPLTSGDLKEDEVAESEGAKAWFNAIYRDEAGRIPPNGIANANAQRRAMIAFQKRYQTAKPTTPARWRAIGPNNLSGRVNAVGVDPDDSNHILAGTATGGLWQSHDKGATWALVSDAWNSMSIGSIAFSRSNSQVIYAGTGGNDSGQAVVNSAGIYKSTDGGATWNLLPSTANFDGIQYIAVSWVDP